MLLSRVIEESDAVDYSHPVIVQKTADSFRFCVDYRHLNECTEAASWPLPNIRDLFERIGHQAVYIRSYGFNYRVPSSSFGLGIQSLDSIYLLLWYLPIHQVRAPSYFQEMMATVVLVGLIYISCEMYLDRLWPR